MWVCYEDRKKDNRPSVARVVTKKKNIYHGEVLKMRPFSFKVCSGFIKKKNKKTEESNHAGTSMPFCCKKRQVAGIEPGNSKAYTQTNIIKR